VELPPISLAAGEVRVLHVVAASGAVRLAEVRVRGQTVCRIREDSGQLVARLWEQARAALSATQLRLGTRPLVAKLELAPVEAKVVSLSASSSDEITGALEEQGHGLFTYHLLKALGETAGRGTVAEVYASLKPRVQDEARRQNRAQTPQSFGSTDAGLR